MSIYQTAKKTSNKPKIITICGTAHNVGTTMISIALSNYLCSKQNLRTAYIELNGSKQIQSLNSSGKSNVFTYLGIDFFPNTVFDTLPFIYQLHYDYCVLDLGVLNQNNYPEFARGSHCMVVGMASPWNVTGYGDFISHLLTTTTMDQGKLIFLGNLGTKRNLTRLNRQYAVSIHAFPYLDNPFQLTSQDWGIFKELLENT